MSTISVYLGTFEREGQMQKYYIFLNLGSAADPAQANTTVLQSPIIETRAEVLLGLARADALDCQCLVENLRRMTMPFHRQASLFSLVLDLPQYKLLI